ncbi:ABC transporter ATP-binding protein [Streptococcus sanguinis]|jgi:ABC-type MDR transport system ATPase component|uniref:Multidrug resistance ABC transporter ATPase component n=1 Tax=Streptococcus sanguinis TaxID=1305 RepID=A0A2X3V1K8_STRSA|nr:ABC transporter ATP-binding protein [Streptococcus sanguinis]SQF35134.1 multidrug resistance ABC transporter ATPase component [Streptococcus sanguinis]
MENILQIENITKNYDGVAVVNNLSFSLKKGHILGFLGPNGAGKSTTINMISSLIGQDDGYIYYEEVPLEKCRKKFKSEIGVVPQSLAIYEDLTAYQNLKFFAELYGVPKDRVEEVCTYALNFVNLENVKYKKAQTFSGGMKRRLNIACSLVNSPKLIILDEPTVGIDPQSRNFILEAIKKLRDKGVSVIYTTHYMEEIEAIAEDVVIVDHGQKLIDDTLENIREKYSKQSIVSVRVDLFDQDLSEKILAISGVDSVSVDGKLIKISINTEVNNKVLNNITDLFNRNNSSILSIDSLNLNLEDIFLELTGKKLRD